MKPGNVLRLLRSGLRQITSNEVHVLCASLDLPLPYVQCLSRILSPDERARASKFYFERDRNYFILRRGLLRIILGSYLEIEPSRITFNYEPHGKPVLKTTFDNKDIQFNLSHSKSLVLYAISRERRVGIDIEHVRSVPEANRIVEKFFSSHESFVLGSLPADQRMEAFFKIWTCKEAYLKVTGDGLSRPLDQIEVSFIPGEASGLYPMDGYYQDIPPYHLVTFKPVPAYLASLAVEGYDWRMVFQQLNVPDFFESEQDIRKN